MLDDLLVDFCRNGELGPLAFGLHPNEVVERIGPPERIKIGHGDDCFQTYRYPSLVLGMRCFRRDPIVRGGAEVDRVLASIQILCSGEAPLTLPEAITRSPVRSPASLRLSDAQCLLAERGVEMALVSERLLTWTLDGATTRLVGDDDGFVDEVSAGWLPEPGGWFYSEENETGVWVAGGARSAEL